MARGRAAGEGRAAVAARAPPAIAYPLPVAAPTLAQKTVSAPAVAVTAVSVTPVSVTPPASLSPSDSFTVSEDQIRVVALADGTEEEHDDDSQTLVHGGYEYRAFPSPCVPHGVSSYHAKPKFMLPAGFEVVSLDADFAAARDVVVRDHGWSALLLAVRAEPGSSAKTFTAFYTKNKSRGSEPGVEKGPTRWILSSGVISGREAFQVTDPGTRLLARRRLSAEALKQREVRGAAQARATARVAAARVAHEEGGARRLTMQPLGARPCRRRRRRRRRPPAAHAAQGGRAAQGGGRAPPRRAHRARRRRRPPARPPLGRRRDHRRRRRGGAAPQGDPALVAAAAPRDDVRPRVASSRLGAGLRGGE